MVISKNITAAFALTALWVFPPANVSDGQEKKGSPLPKGIIWKLDALDRAPLKVITTFYDPKNRSVSWVIELVRDLDVYEDGAYWAPAFKEKRTRFRFELQNEHGIVMKTVDGRYVGEYVTKAGKRFGAMLELPPDVYDQLKTVEALPK